MVQGGQLETVKEEAAPWVKRLARFGYASKGFVYVVVGWLSLQAALGTGGATVDTRGALESIFRQPFGPLLLMLVSMGFLCYAGWRLAQGALDVEGKGRALKGLVKRTGYLVSGFAYGGLGVAAFRQSVGLATTEGRSQEDWTALVLAHPAGRWLVFAAGLLLAGLAVNAAIIALGGLFRRKLKSEEMAAVTEQGAVSLAVAGLLARAVVFALIAAFFFRAAWYVDPSDAGGLSDVLVTIAGQPYGPFLLGLVAVGLLSYGLFAMVQARFRRMPFG